jgi:hypothetical protein
MMSAPPPLTIESEASLESLPPTIVWPVLVAATSTVSAPSLANSTMEPIDPLATMLSLSVPRLTIPVLPAWSTTVSEPESPVTVAAPDPVKMQSSPDKPTIAPGPVPPDWLSVSPLAVPVTA